MSDPAPAADPSEQPDLVEENPELSAALTGIGDLDQQPLEEHHEALTRAHEVLQRALDDPPAEG